MTVAETTGIAATLGITSVCVDRAGWAHATLDGLEPVLDVVGRRAAARAPGTATRPRLPSDAAPEMGGDIGAFLMQSLLPLLLGVWSGSMIGQLAHHALGQYDLPLPLHGPPTQRFLVRNVEAFGEEWALPADELRYALALREVVHGAQRSVPWVRDELERLATDYVGAYEVQPDALQEQLGDIDLDRSVVDGGARPARRSRARCSARCSPSARRRCSKRCSDSCRCSRATPTSSSRRSASA